MRLAPPFSRFAGLLLALALVVAPAGSRGEDAPARMLMIGTGPEPGSAAASLPRGALVTLDTLPGEGGVETALFGARLRANPVSTFPDTAPLPPAAFEELFTVIRAELGEEDAGARLTIGGESFTIPRFGARLAETAAAFEARFRRVAFLEIADPDHAFPAVMAALRAALDPLGFDLLVMMIAHSESANCPHLEPLHLSIASGLADRAPFGDANGATTLAEAERYLDAALRRAVARDCGPAYNLIVKAADDPDRVLVARPLAPFPEVEDRLEREVFEAMFLRGSDNAEALAGYLGTCTYCPSEASLRARLQDTAARARIAALEDEMWEEIRDDTGRERLAIYVDHCRVDIDREALAIYVDHCRVCTHSDAALTRIERLDARAAAEESERRSFARARDTRDLAALRGYVESCEACAYGDEARTLIAELESDGAYRAERALLAEALDAPDPGKLEDYLAACSVCDGAAEVEAALERLAARERLLAPCLAAAGLPQMGGPRKLEDIDQPGAAAVCAAAAAAFPDDGLLRVLEGRIAQARGDTAAASEAYSHGMEQGVPAAFGLAAYAHYAPADGAPIDPLRVEALALEGAAKGDWLSREVLTVLYSKDLVPGKSGPEAFDIAMGIAREGNPLAQYFVGHFYMTGEGGEVSTEKAAEWLGRAVAAGYTRASAFLADLYEQGTGAGASPERAGELYWSALQQGDATAAERLTTELASRSAEVVRIIQGKLREQGLYRGAVDGVPGPGTEAAIRAYANSLSGQG